MLASVIGTVESLIAVAAIVFVVIGLLRLRSSHSAGTILGAPAEPTDSTDKPTSPSLD